MIRTHFCGQLRSQDAGTEVSLCGWVHTRRDHGGVTFVDLRDTTGLVQIVFNPAHAKEAHEVAEKIRGEYCINVKGSVHARPEGTVNARLATGEIEVMADEVTILSTSETLPFQIDDVNEVDEQLRLRYRYLDLRREHMQDNLKLRHKIVSAIRRFL